jgi:hypothetical protein
MYCILFEASRSRYKFPVISKAYKKKKKDQLGFVVKGREIIYGFGKKKLARLHPNFNYVLTFETTLKCWEGKAH